MNAFFSLRGRPTIKTDYKGISECALPGQHFALSRMLSEMVPSGASVLDLASGEGAWVRRLSDAGYAVTASELHPEICQVPCVPIDLNGKFSDRFGATKFDAISAIEMLEHIENPRHILRESAALLKDGGKIILSTPNASGLHSRVKFLFTGRFAMFDDTQYEEIGHIRPLTYWEIDKMLIEAGFKVKQVAFHDNRTLVPKTAGEVVKLAASAFLSPFIRGTAGGQVIMVAAEKIGRN